MVSTTPEIDQVLDNVHDLLMRWCREGALGEIAITIGQNQYQIEERPRRRLKPVKREDARAGVVATVSDM